MHGAAALACISERISEQFWRESCSAMRLDMHSIVVAPRISQCTRSMRRPPCGGRRMKCVQCDTRGPAAVR
eukprot:176737-Lingulodinium_polyedra.AAC.1